MKASSAPLEIHVLGVVSAQALEIPLIKGMNVALKVQVVMFLHDTPAGYPECPLRSDR
jgi:hypothetical protein